MILLNNNFFDDLKCCGNCAHRQSIDNQYHVEEACKFDVKPSFDVCDLWKYDNLKKVDRVK
jgi:hypothetical protein